MDWGNHQIYLALDSSSLWDEFVLVRIALIYRGRALPLSWIVLQQQSTMVAFVNSGIKSPQNREIKCPLFRE